MADALWELAGQYEVGLWYEYVRVGAGVNQYDVFCGVVVNGVRLGQPYCRAVEECVEEMLRDYKREVERLREPPEPALVIKIDGSEACISLNPPKAFCAQNGSVREVRLELEFKRYEEYEEKMREVYRPKGLLAFAVAAREYVRML
ncbi:MAG: hypothetical protein RQ859_04135 [Pyrobaculum sp.]|nr:hypothetical protein [Pyrobaculum sp.]